MWACARGVGGQQARALPPTGLLLDGRLVDEGVQRSKGRGSGFDPYDVLGYLECEVQSLDGR